jgi:hypothetical protein
VTPSIARSAHPSTHKLRSPSLAKADGYQTFNSQKRKAFMGTAISATSATDKLNSYRKYGNLLPVTHVSERGVLRTDVWSELAQTDRFQTPSDPRTWVDAALPNFHEKFDTTRCSRNVEYHAIKSYTPGSKTTSVPGPNDVLAMLAARSVSFTVTVGFSPRIVP